MKNKNRIHDLTGNKYGLLTVIGLDDTKTRKTYWVCQCDCGNIKTVRSDSLLCGAIKSCGCLKKKQDRINLAKNHSHKMSGTRIYAIWQGMKSRCNNPHDTKYHRYGGRGIKVCQSWSDSFEAFYKWAVESGYSEELTIDRIDNDSNYEPNNCKWSTNREQCRNRSTNVNITIGNSKRTLTEWCEIFGLDSKVIFARYERNGFQSIDKLFNG